MSYQPSTVSKLITSKELILQAYPEVFDGIGCFPGPPYHIQVNPRITPKIPPCQPVPVHFKEPFMHETACMILKHVHQATPWINSFVLVDKLDKLKLRICLDLTNLNKAIIHELYHFKTPEDTAHPFEDAFVITVGNCRKGYWHHQLDEDSSFLPLSILSLVDFDSL